LTKIATTRRRLLLRHGRAEPRRAVAAATLPAFLAVLGPGLLAGLSDDDPAGITTYSILGARFGYQLLWVLLLSTAALVVFHELAARMGLVTGCGLLTLVRRRYGRATTAVVAGTLIVANLGTTAAEFAGVAASLELAGISRYVSVPLTAIGLSVLTVKGSFHRIEHVLLLLSGLFVTYIASGVLAHPDWREATHGLLIPSMPLTREAFVISAAVVGTTLAPWGLAFIQSYAVDKHLHASQLRFERVDVISGAVMTGLIGAFVVIACAATLHASGRTTIETAHDAALGLEPLAGHLASALFGAGLLGAALLAAAIVPLSTAYSVSEAIGVAAALDDSVREAPVFYGTYWLVMGLGAGIVLIPKAPLIDILFVTQVVNTVLLVPLLFVIIQIGRDREVMGDYRNGPAGHALACAAAAVVGLSLCGLAAASLL
jgi:NRAMP (natural resistance-associated macrophage protein)-like metal ion transporter